MYELIRDRLPARADIRAAFSVAVFCIFSWSIRGYLFKFPAFILFFSINEMLAVLFYMMSFALLESLLVTGGLVVLSIFLPSGWLKKGFSYKSFLFVCVSALIMIVFQKSMMKNFVSFEIVFRLGWIWIVSLIVSIIMVDRLEPFKRISNLIVDNLSVFLYVYVPLGVLSLVVVVFRNLFKA